MHWDLDNPIKIHDDKMKNETYFVCSQKHIWLCVNHVSNSTLQNIENTYSTISYTQ